jgi:hypothetical protein
VQSIGREHGDHVGESLDQVGLGDQHVDRDVELERVGDLVDAAAQDARAFAKVRRCADQGRDRDGDHEPVERAFGAALPQQLEQPDPAGIGLLCGEIAPGRVEHDRLVGQPPVAVRRRAVRRYVGLIRR